MKKLCLIIAMLMMFSSVGAWAEDAQNEVFDYSVDFTAITDYPADNIVTRNVSGQFSGGFKQKIETGDGKGYGHSINVRGANSEVTYAQATVNAVWNSGFTIGFVPVGKTSATEYIKFNTDGKVYDEDGRLLTSYTRAQNNNYVIGVYTDSTNKVSHLYVGGVLVAGNLDYNIEKIEKINFHFFKTNSTDYRPITLKLSVTCDTEKIASLPAVKTPYEYSQDFSGGIPADSYFEKGSGYSDIVSGQYRTKVESNDCGFYVKSLSSAGAELYTAVSVCPYGNIAFRLSARNTWDSSNTAWLLFDTVSGKITDSAGNEIADGIAAGKFSNIGLLMNMNTKTAKLFIDGKQAAENIAWDISNLSKVGFTWVPLTGYNSGGTRSLIDNVLLTSDAEKFPVISYYQDFNCAEMPSDSYFSYSGYNYLQNGALYTKVQSASNQGVVLNLPNYSYDTLYSSVNATFKQKVSLSIQANGVEIVKFNGSDGIAYDAQGNALTQYASTVPTETMRKISLYVYGDGKMAVFADGKLVGANLECSGKITTLSYKWSDTSGMDLRVYVDNLVVTQVEDEFGTESGIGNLYFTEADNTLKANTDIINFSALPITASLVIARYSGGEMTYVDVIPVTAQAGKISEINESVPTAQGESVKVMLLEDMETIKPVCKFIER